MIPQYKHLKIEKEIFNNERRTKSPPPRFRRNDNLQLHGQKLKDYLHKATLQARQQTTSEPGKYILKLNGSSPFPGAQIIKNTTL